MLADGLLVFLVEIGILVLDDLAHADLGQFFGHQFLVEQATLDRVLSCTKVAITSFRSSRQIRVASSLLGVARPLISIWNLPSPSLKPTLHFFGS